MVNALSGGALRRRGYWIEADYERDKKLRQCAVDFYNGLIRVVKYRPELLIPRPDGGCNLHAQSFWKHPKSSRFMVIFLPGKALKKGGIGKAGNVDVIILPVMKGPGDVEHLDILIDRDTVVHEVIHYLDPGYSNAKGVGRFYANGKVKKDELLPRDYYNDPLEWNAFWNEGANKVETAMKSMIMSNPSTYAYFFGDGTLREFQKKVGHYWDRQFIVNMNAKTRRKFDKRLSQLWQAMRRYTE